MGMKCDQSHSHRPEQLHAGTMPVRTHVDESGLGVGFSIFATTTGKDCVTRVTLTYAITESRVINPATAAVTPRIDRLRAMTVSASANNAQIQQDVLGGTTRQWGQWNALYTAAFIPTFLLSGCYARVFLCRFC